LDGLLGVHVRFLVVLEHKHVLKFASYSHAIPIHLKELKRRNVATAHAQRKMTWTTTSPRAHKDVDTAVYECKRPTKSQTKLVVPHYVPGIATALRLTLTLLPAVKMVSSIIARSLQMMGWKAIIKRSARIVRTMRKLTLHRKLQRSFDKVAYFFPQILLFCLRKSQKHCRGGFLESWIILS